MAPTKRLCRSIRTTAVTVIDVNDIPASPLLTENIAPVLQAAHTVGMRVFYFHEDGYGVGGPADITRELRCIKLL
ncbi:MAG: hypothetical protein MI924_08645 [Chloroflexales bacterium]|nr:hypothetical protein [Chloroflexales bacterium]